jgi:methylated-DNA-[protein]-cysteine S-methyltransferase
MDAIFHDTVQASWGKVSFAFNPQGELLEISLRSRRSLGAHGKRPEAVPSSAQLASWLREYGSARAAKFPGQWSNPGRSDFRRLVYRAVARIPAGQVLSYGEVAGLAGSAKAARAVGTAMAQNPLPLLVP